MNCKPTSGERELLSQLIKDFEKEGKRVWALKKMKAVHPIIECSARELGKLEPIRFIKLKEDEIIASNEVEGIKIKNPVAKPFHPTAIGVHLIYDFKSKTLEFSQLNSAIKGWGEKMVKAGLVSLPKDWKVLLVFDWSNGFWKRMQQKYPHVHWLQI